ncbi:hypothetical protein IFM89_036836 [Coptis chinensis]|uniref:Uncharacterized protein n=1 Tax=Coptis chinensis TaxID=261450 RepID=A0A835H303_9MAGN|nr:hypothetical protein IFM89_036836 [Coptis chinensis]
MGNERDPIRPYRGKKGMSPFTDISYGTDPESKMSRRRADGHKWPSRRAPIRCRRELVLSILFRLVEMTLREEIIAEKKGKGGAGDLKSVLRMQHLQNISVWAAGEVGMPSYAAFLGNCFGKYSEASGLPIDPSFIPCQRFTTYLTYWSGRLVAILLPGKQGRNPLCKGNLKAARLGSVCLSSVPDETDIPRTAVKAFLRLDWGRLERMASSSTIGTAHSPTQRGKERIPITEKKGQESTHLEVKSRNGLLQERCLSLSSVCRLAYTALKGKIGTGLVEAETLVALSSLIGNKPTGRERTSYFKYLVEWTLKLNGVEYEYIDIILQEAVTFEATKFMISSSFSFAFLFITTKATGISPAFSSGPPSEPIKVSKGVLMNEPNWKMDPLAVQGLGLCVLETLGENLGWRVQLTRQYHQALDASVAKNFPDNGIIACMSHNTDSVYCSKQTAIVRALDDFYPRDPVSHIHPVAEYHASARAISGGNIYVSDAPGKHNFEILRKLVLPNGSTLRARFPGRPTKDCLTCLATAAAQWDAPTYPDLDPGQLWLLRASNINTEKLARIAVRHGLFHFFRHNAPSLDAKAPAVQLP